MFVDAVKVTLRAGKGGNGVVAWRREKFVPKGGPVGGDGGNGASITFVAEPQILCLESFRNQRLIYAEDGMAGGGNLRKGRNGKNLVLKVPCGTLVRDAITKEILFDFVDPGQTHLICEGGKGGKGNARFKSPTNQAPNTCTLGTAGEAREIELELKLIADIGLIGMPNAGKSTLMSKITYRRVKIGAYPFTTLFPNLSYAKHTPGFKKTLIADIPGLIENAHLNKGLGIAFLKHVERSSALIYVIDISGVEGRDPFQDFLILQNELRAYRPDLLDKPFLVALNKTDCLEAEEHLKTFPGTVPLPSRDTLSHLCS